MNMDIFIDEATGIKRASGIIRHGAIYISVPKRWPKSEKVEATDYLTRVLSQKAKKEQALLARLDHWMDTPEGQAQLITLDSQTALERYVHQLNAETLQVPLAKVRIGQAKFSRLAQMNIQTRTMTVSKYCLRGVPEAALRYLLIHELAHLIEANHSKRFWRLVAQFVPDYKHQSDLMKAFHKRAVDLEVIEENTTAKKILATQPITSNALKAKPEIKPSKPRILPLFEQFLPKNPTIAVNKTPRPSKPLESNPVLQVEEATAEPPAHLKRWWQLKLF